MKNGYTIYSPETASKDAQVILLQVRENLKFVPNALGAMAESPHVLQAYLQLGELVQQTSFSDVERHLLYLTIAREYGSTYCMAAHTMFAAMDNIPDALVQQLREGKMLDDPRLDALQQFAVKMVNTGCNVSEQDIQAFINAGYNQTQIIELSLVMANKLLAVFCLRIMGTDLDEMLAPAKWEQVSYTS